MKLSVASPSLMARISAFFPSLTTFFSSYRFDAHAWHTNSEITLRVVTKTGLKSYLPFFSWQLERIENGHSVASPSELVWIFDFFPSLTTFFSSYRFDAHMWHTTCKGTLGVVTKTGSKVIYPFFPGSLRGSKMEHSVASPSLMARILAFFQV